MNVIGCISLPLESYNSLSAYDEQWVLDTFQAPDVMYKIHHFIILINVGIGKVSMFLYIDLDT